MFSDSSGLSAGTCGKTQIGKKRIHKIISQEIRFPSAYHMASVVDLQKGQTLCSAGKTDTFPFMLLGRIEFTLAVPLQIESPRLVTKIVTASYKSLRYNQNQKILQEAF